MLVIRNLKDIESNSNYTFLYGDITDEIYVKSIFEKHKFEYVIHLAAESHVDRSIKNPLSFAKTNIMGTIILLNSFKSIWQENWKINAFIMSAQMKLWKSW